ncbi:MAG: anaerobic ribonucleoside-triphosphate reductase activating protein [Spirochaetia bacterium]|jgi:pyruvate formate lyase activating enzyme
MKIGGFQKFSLSDFPGRIAAIVFTQGCGFRCPYCHNPELVDPSRYAAAIPQEQVLDFMRSRRGRLQGVVITGGEPTLHDDLPRFLAGIKEMGFAVKLDTNGSNPCLLDRIIAEHLADYIAMDLKAPLLSYSRVTGVRVKTSDIERSLQLVKGSGLPHELRTTYLESVLSVQDMREIARLARGCERFVLQKYRATKALDPQILHEPSPGDARIEKMRRLLEAAGLKVSVR